MANGNLYSVSVISARLHLSRSFLYKAIERNKLPHYKIGTRVLVSEDQIQDFLKNHEQKSEKTCLC